MKTNKHFTIVFLLLLSGFSAFAQQEVVDDSESVIILSEDDIVSLTKTLRTYQKNKSSKASLNNTEPSAIEKKNTEKSSFEVDYLRNQISQLEALIVRLNNAKTASNPDSNLSSESISNTTNRRELDNIKYEISQLKNLIQQLANRPNNDLTVVVPSTQPEAKSVITPKAPIINEQINSKDQDNIALANKLDSLNMLFKSLKPSDNTDYSGDFNALEKRIAELQKELALKNSEPNTYEILVSKYKGYSRNIYFLNNSIVLNMKSNKVVNELYVILDKNDNVDIVVKGFASNKGNALYNENLSMQRTESVKKALILRGVHPTRVLTQYHGIDYNATADEARRVEISILVRK